MPPPLASLLDGGQVLQHSFDDATGTLRTTATATVVGGDITIESTHLDDSIRLGDGTSFFTSTTIGPKVGLDVNIINGTTLEIVIDEANDSIQIYGNDGSINQPIKTDTNGRLEIVSVEPDAPEIFNVSVPLATTEVSQALPSGTKRFLIRSRDSASKIQMAFVSGQSGTNFLQINRGCVYESPKIDGTGLTLYFQTAVASSTVEILAWKTS